MVLGGTGDARAMTLLLIGLYDCNNEPTEVLASGRLLLKYKKLEEGTSDGEAITLLLTGHNKLCDCTNELTEVSASGCN